MEAGAQVTNIIIIINDIVYEQTKTDWKMETVES